MAGSGKADATAQKENVPAYIVFNDATLMAVAEALPGDERDLLSISGIGPRKVERYGAGLLEVVARFR